MFIERSTKINRGAVLPNVPMYRLSIKDLQKGYDWIVKFPKDISNNSVCDFLKSFFLQCRIRFLFFNGFF